MCLLVFLSLWQTDIIKCLTLPGNVKHFTMAAFYTPREDISVNVILLVHISCFSGMSCDLITQNFQADVGYTSNHFPTGMASSGGECTTNRSEIWLIYRVNSSLVKIMLGPIPETIRSLWKSDRITNFSSAYDFSMWSDSTNDPASIGSWSWRSCSLRGSVLDQKFHHNNWSFY